MTSRPTADDAVADPARAAAYEPPPSLVELAAVALAALVHVAVESWVSQDASRRCNRVAAVLFGAYAVWRLYRVPGMAGAWGLWGRPRSLRAVTEATVMTLASSGLMILAGWQFGTLHWSRHYWPWFLVYPLYGIVQQFALQNLVLRNLPGFIRPLHLRVLFLALIFALVHAPRMRLVLLAFGGGLLLTVFHLRHRNLWLTGVAHGWIAAVAFASLMPPE